MGFRKDINALRAMAVLAVVIFHFSPGLMPGGFSGVDVFFVVSGYLMTSIIFTKSEAGSFSFLDFYKSRAKRIVPALLALCLVLTIYGLLFIYPSDLLMLGEHVASSVLFLSNFTYWMESGYFDAASHSKWLLHTWSLSVEWQFYIVYPVVVIGLLRFFGASGAKVLIAVMAFSSFLASAYFSVTMPSFAYFMLPTRAWELMAGGLVFLCPLRVKESLKPFVEGSGLALIVAGVFLFDSNMAWPGCGGLVPVLGACLIITSNRQGGFFADSKFLFYMGKWSYSIYLWHWPIAVYLYINRHVDPVSVISGIIASIILGAGSYRFIESIYSSRSTRDAQGFQIATPALSFLLVSLVASDPIIHSNAGFTSRFSSDMDGLLSISDVYSYYEFPQNIRAGVCHSVTAEEFELNCVEKREKMIFIWGDSFAAALYPGVKQVRDESFEEWGIAQMTDGNGPPFFIGRAKTDNLKTMKEANSERLSAVEKYRPDVVLISWAIYGLNGIYEKQEAVFQLGETVRKIKDASPLTRVVVVGPPLAWDSNLVGLMLEYWRGNNSPPPLYMKYGLEKTMKGWDEFFYENIPSIGVDYVSAYNVFCREDGCITRLSGDFTDLPVVDSGHLTKGGSIYLLRAISSSVFGLN